MGKLIYSVLNGASARAQVLLILRAGCPQHQSWGIFWFGSLSLFPGDSVVKGDDALLGSLEI